MNIAAIIVKYRKPIMNVVGSIASMVIADQIVKIARQAMAKDEEEPTEEVEEEVTEEETATEEKSTDEETE